MHGMIKFDKYPVSKAKNPLNLSNQQFHRISEVYKVSMLYLEILKIRLSISIIILTKIILISYKTYIRKPRIPNLQI